MQDITEKQIAEWKEELIRQVQTRDNAQKELDAANININALQGGVQFGELLLKKNESLGQQSNTMELGTPRQKVNKVKGVANLISISLNIILNDSYCF